MLTWDITSCVLTHSYGRSGLHPKLKGGCVLFSTGLECVPEQAGLLCVPVCFPSGSFTRGLGYLSHSAHSTHMLKLVAEIEGWDIKKQEYMKTRCWCLQKKRGHHFKGRMADLHAWRQIWEWDSVRTGHAHSKAGHKGKDWRSAYIGQLVFVLGPFLFLF